MHRGLLSKLEADEGGGDEEPCAHQLPERKLTRTIVPARIPSRRVMRTGRAELHPRWTPEWLLAQDVDERLASVIRRFRVSSTIHVPIVWAGQPYAVAIFAATGA
jgi:hypothetical protein